jgi:hypothetical protein
MKIQIHDMLATGEIIVNRLVTSIQMKTPGFKCYNHEEIRSENKESKIEEY